MADHGDRSTPMRKRDVTRQRLLDAANARFREQGYDGATAAGIASDAGVTERTFFRYFPTKADVLVANWERHGDRLRAVLDTSPDPDVAAVVTEALTAFLRGVSVELAAGLDSVVRLYTDRSAFLAIMEHLLDVEHDLAAGIGRRTGRDTNDFNVRVAANGSLGVLRAAVRAAVLDETQPDMIDLFRHGMETIEPAFSKMAPPPVGGA